MKKTLFCSFLLGFTFLSSGCLSENRVEFIKTDDQIDVMVNNQLITSYLIGQQLSKPILYPLTSPSGEAVTRWYPLKEVEGESNDHAHHTGVFFTYGSNGEVNGNSFWYNPHDSPPFNMDAKLPRISHVEILEIAEGRGNGKLVTLNHWIDKYNKPILEENRVMEFFVREDEYIIDFTIRLTPVDTTVTFKDTKEGLFAIRVADWLAENARGTLYESKGEYFNSHGEMRERNIWGKRSSWMRLEGEKEGKTIGVVIFNHPRSINYPTFWHARGYGCFSANPLGQYDFMRDTRQDNPQHLTLTLSPGESALFKFRMIVYEGMRDKNQLDYEFEVFSSTLP